MKDNEYELGNLASYWNMKFKEAMLAKADYTSRWKEYMDAYNGSFFDNESLPSYRSNQVSNYIFSNIETMRPIMLDNNPKFQVMPRNPEAIEFANDVQDIMNYEWDRTNMQASLSRQLISTLVYGTSVYYMHWDKDEKEVVPLEISPQNIFPDPLATCVEDAEYIIYAAYMHENILKKAYPKYTKELQGSQVNYSELVYENNESDGKIDNQILVLEIFCQPHVSTMEEDKQSDKQRIITVCPELNLVLRDRTNPYKFDTCAPIVLIKDYDVPGKFWGEGEVAQLLSPQTYINDLTNQIIDNAKQTANMPWILDKNSGIGYNVITNRPGLVLRKNPGSEVRREQPPSMPPYVSNMVGELKSDMESICGVFDTVKGNSETGVYTAQGILALQEAGQSRIRLKVKVLESALGVMCSMWYKRISQFWGKEKLIYVSHNNGEYDIKKISDEQTKHMYDIKISAGSTMAINRGAMLDLMIRLAQTAGEDGAPMVDREAVLEYLPVEAKSAIMKRVKGESQKIQMLQQALEENTQKDEQNLEVIEQLVESVEYLNEQIGQLKQEHDKMKQDEQEQEKHKKSYNSGYKDAEQIYQGEMQQFQAMNEMPEEDDDENMMEEINQSGGEIPIDIDEDILQGIENLSDDELELLMMEHPEIAELIG